MSMAAEGACLTRSCTQCHCWRDFAATPLGGALLVRDQSVNGAALRAVQPPPRTQGRRQMILPAYPLSAGIDSVLVTMHVPRFVSIVSPGWGGGGGEVAFSLSFHCV